MTKVIGITGFKRHGKGEVGAAIARLVPGTVQVGFADNLKISMMRTLGFDRPETDLIALADSLKVDATIQMKYRDPEDFDVSDEMWRMHELTGRELLQWFGTEGGRQTFGTDFWVDLVLPRPAEGKPDGGGLVDEHNLKYRYDGAPIVAITDVRFDNEAQRVKDVGGVLWEVVRPELVDASEDTHASEAGVDPALIDTVIINDGTLESLQWRVEQALELDGAFYPA